MNTLYVVLIKQKNFITNNDDTEVAAIFTDEQDAKTFAQDKNSHLIEQYDLRNYKGNGSCFLYAGDVL